MSFQFGCDRRRFLQNSAMAFAAAAEFASLAALAHGGEASQKVIDADGFARQ
jgi:hypothetical protein